MKPILVGSKRLTEAWISTARPMCCTPTGDGNWKHLRRTSEGYSFECELVGFQRHTQRWWLAITRSVWPTFMVLMRAGLKAKVVDKLRSSRPRHWSRWYRLEWPRFTTRVTKLPTVQPTKRNGGLKGMTRATAALGNWLLESQHQTEPSPGDPAPVDPACRPNTSWTTSYRAACRCWPIAFITCKQALAKWAMATRHDNGKCFSEAKTGPGVWESPVQSELSGMKSVVIDSLKYWRGDQLRVQ